LQEWKLKIGGRSFWEGHFGKVILGGLSELLGVSGVRLLCINTIIPVRQASKFKVLPNTKHQKCKKVISRQMNISLKQKLENPVFLLVQCRLLGRKIGNLVSLWITWAGC